MTDLLQFQVPATIAHLGPGFGVLGMAVDLFMTITARKGTTAGHHVERRGATARMDERHEPVLRGLTRAAEQFQIKLPPALALLVDSAIPPACGLGSNSAGFAAGIACAVRFAKKAPSFDAMLDALVDLGGDPAHGAAALRGGLTAACQITGPSEALRFRILPQILHSNWRLGLAVPSVHLGTADNRRILPPTLPHATLPRTAGRIVGLLHALSQGDADLLAPCLRDEVHVPFRRSLVPGLEQAMAAAVQAGAAGATIAGHGPGVVALALDEATATRAAEAMAASFRSKGLESLTFLLRARNIGAVPL